jgi:hypothetical protein
MAEVWWIRREFEKPADDTIRQPHTHPQTGIVSIMMSPPAVKSSSIRLVATGASDGRSPSSWQAAQVIIRGDDQDAGRGGGGQDGATGVAAGLRGCESDFDSVSFWMADAQGMRCGLIVTNSPHPRAIGVSSFAAHIGRPVSHARRSGDGRRHLRPRGPHHGCAQFWSAAHGVATLLMAIPCPPWGDVG